jgi:photosystem II stability/assembly factor-like uncharacterized protein
MPIRRITKSLATILLAFSLTAPSALSQGVSEGLVQRRALAEQVDQKWQAMSQEQRQDLLKELAPFFNSQVPQKEEEFEYLHGIEFRPPGHGWAVDWNGKIYSSVDGGITWSAMRLVDPSFIKFLNPHAGAFRAMSFSDAEFGMIVGPVGILQTMDGGRSWKHYRPLSVLSISTAVFCDRDRICWVGGSKAHAIFRRDEPNGAWTRYSTPARGPITAIQFTNNKIGWATSRSGEIIGTVDGGRHWSDLFHDAQRRFFALDFVNKDSGWIVGHKGVVMHTADGGKTWVDQKLMVPTNVPVDEVNFNAVKFADSKRGWAAGQYGIIFGTKDAGKHWTLQRFVGLGVRASEFSIYALAVTGGPTVWAAGNGGNIFVSIDDGAYWFPVNGPFARDLDELARTLVKGAS